MNNSINRNWLILVVACALAVTACSDKKAATADSSALTATDSILAYVPANTPYVFVKSAPLPDALSDKLEPKIDLVFESYQAVMREMIKSHTQKLSQDDGELEKAEQVIAIIEEMISLLSVDGMRSAGFGRESTFAIYGNGLLPVLRMQLTDGKLFEAEIARIEAQAGEQLPTAELDGQSYRYVDSHEARFMIAVFGDQAVFTLAPASFSDEKLAQLVGLSPPATSIAEAGELQQIATEFGFTQQYIGFFNPVRLAETFLDDPSGLDADLIAMLDHEPLTLSDVCKEEIRSVVGLVPRIVFGYTEISEDRIDESMIIELRDDIAAGLSSITAAVPGLGVDHGGLISFGMSMNPLAARNFYEARLDAMEADPFECELFNDAQAGVAKGREALSQPIPPMAYDFKGFLAVVDEIDGLDFASKAPPESIKARFLLAMDNVAALIGMGAMFSQELAELDLQAGAEPVPFELPGKDGAPVSTYLAMSDDALALSVGEGVEEKLTDMLEAASHEPPPFMSMTVDARQYYALVGKAVAAADDGENAPSKDMRAALQDAMVAIADIINRMTIHVRFTSRGIEIESDMTLAD